MEITVDVPDWMIRDYESKTKQKLDTRFVEVAARAYYMWLYDPMYKHNLSEATMVALYGDE